MNLKILTEFDYDLKLFREVDTKTTDFAKREGMEYEGWCVEEVDCNGAIASIYENDGKIEYINRFYPYIGIRPAVNYNEIAEQAKVIKEYDNGLKEVEYGEYPQEEVMEALQEKLNQDLIDGQLEKTGKEYTIYNNDEQNPDTIKLIEVKDKDGNKYVNKNDTWYKVSPVRWMVNEETNLALTKYMIQGGIPYGEYELPPIPEQAMEYQFKHYKLPPCVKLMHQLRKVNPTIIEGFLNVVLSEDLLPEPTKKKEIVRPKLDIKNPFALGANDYKLERLEYELDIEYPPQRHYWERKELIPMDPIPGKGPLVPMDPIPGKGPLVPMDPIPGQNPLEPYCVDKTKVKKM